MDSEYVLQQLQDDSTKLTLMDFRAFCYPKKDKFIYVAGAVHHEESNLKYPIVLRMHPGVVSRLIKELKLNVELVAPSGPSF